MKIVPPNRLEKRREVVPTLITPLALRKYCGQLNPSILKGIG
tara:strand:- start:254 stop:379 length:126 start_codon:yes stop_codon:yes gene_type:complete